MMLFPFETNYNAEEPRRPRRCMFKYSETSRFRIHKLPPPGVNFSNKHGLRPRSINGFKRVRVTRLFRCPVSSTTSRSASD